MDKLADFMAKLELQNQISLSDIPEIDLYMDQVIQLFENKFNALKRNEDEKILTKTMINNYAKAKLFFPIKNKKYSKEHLILISLIYQLKGALSINDIKDTLHGLNEKITNDENFQLQQFYQSYLNLHEINVKNVKEHIEDRVSEVNDEVKGIEGKDPEYLEKVLLIASLVNISNLYRRAAEKLVDEIAMDIRKKETK